MPTHHRRPRPKRLAAALPGLLALACSAAANPGPAPEPTPAGPAAQEEAPAAERFDQAHAAWTGILARHVRGDRFDYAAVAKDRSDLDAYLETLAAVTPEQLGRWKPDEQLAFFINAYNAGAVSLVASNLPLESIEDLSTEELRVWKREFIPLGPHLEGAGAELSLDELEHELIRPRYRDARIHVAVNCASVGCPPLRPEAFRGADLDRQLDEQLAAFFADESRNRFDARTETARVSKIFEWFAADFEREAGSVAGFLAAHGPREHRTWLAAATIEYLEYDWALNDVPREADAER